MIQNVYALGGGIDRFRVILVTGPQRSGTTFVANCFAHDTKRPYVDEAAFGTGNYDLFMQVVHGASVCVMQAPSMMKFAHHVPDDVLVVVVRRNVVDIVASQERIGWGGERLELARYGLEEGCISQVKYDYWDRNKDVSPSSWMEVQYESMLEHPLWVGKEDRASFSPKQTSGSPH